MYLVKKNLFLIPMSIVKVHNKEFKMYIEEARIQNRVFEIADEVFKQMQGQVPHFVVILNGAFIFASDLLRAYQGPCKISFVKLSSYTGMKTSGVVHELIGLSEIAPNDKIIVLEDIVDTGTTLLKVDEIFKAKQIKWQIASLFVKPDVYCGDRKINYVGFEIPNKFIVGYGLDYDGLGRNLRDIYQLAKA